MLPAHHDEGLLVDFTFRAAGGRGELYFPDGAVVFFSVVAVYSEGVIAAEDAADVAEFLFCVPPLTEVDVFALGDFAGKVDAGIGRLRR